MLCLIALRIYVELIDKDRSKLFFQVLREGYSELLAPMNLVKKYLQKLELGVVLATLLGSLKIDDGVDHQESGIHCLYLLRDCLKKNKFDKSSLVLKKLFYESFFLQSLQGAQFRWLVAG